MGIAINQYSGFRKPDLSKQCDGSIAELFRFIRAMQLQDFTDLLPDTQSGGECLSRILWNQGNRSTPYFLNGGIAFAQQILSTENHTPAQGLETAFEIGHGCKSQ